MHADGLLLSGNGEEYHKFSRFLAVSVVCHIVFFLILAFSPGDDSYRRLSTGVINVDLVSLPMPAGNASAKKTISSVHQKTRKTEKSVTIPKRSKKKSSKKVATVFKKKKIFNKAKQKKSLKKKTFKSAKVVDSAIAQMKKKVDQSHSQQLQQTMNRLAEQVKKKKGTGNSATVGDGYPAGGGRQSTELIDIYMANAYPFIEENYSVTAQFIGSRNDLEVLLGIKIMPDGEIRDVWFDKRSGNAYLDEQARKAVLKTRYLPPLPRGFKGPFLEYGLRFTPSGIR